jgi:hypothetical protein
MKNCDFIEQLRNRQLVKKDFAPYLIIRED